MTRTSTPLRLIAIFEIARGVALLAIAAGILHLLHGGAREAVEALVSRAHLDPVHGIARIFLRLADQASDPVLWIVGLTALADAAFRVAIGVGLWRGRAWGYWLGAAGGAVFIPAEILSLVAHFTIYRVLVLGISVTIVLVLVRHIRRGIPDT